MATTCGSGGETSAGTFDEDFPLDLSQSPEYVEKEPTTRRRRVDAFSERNQTDAALLKLFSNLDQMPK
jgi:hypothetical protein